MSGIKSAMVLIHVLFASAAFIPVYYGSAAGHEQVSGMGLRAQHGERVPIPTQRLTNFDVDVEVSGEPLEQYRARGRSYVEARAGYEYALRLRNPLGVRVAVALSVDGLNTIDARHLSAFNSSKWVIEPYGEIRVSGWQMSSSRARRFYFTSESDSYGAKLRQTNDLGVISAVFFRERERIPAVTRTDRPENEGSDDYKSPQSPSANATAPAEKGGARSSQRAMGKDEYAATGIGRNVQNDVRWVRLDLESTPISSVNIRYEYRDVLVRLGILPRPFDRDEAIRRRERAEGFANAPFCPEP
jgi:hypothetical protein